MHDNPPILVWLRRDLRLSDHPALTAAAQSGQPVIPVFIADDLFDALGAAPALRLEQSIAALGAQLSGIGSRLILRRGPARDVLNTLIAETGANAVYWTRAYDPGSTARDTEIKIHLKERGIGARSFGGSLLFEPWTVATKAGTPHRVYTPFWKAVRDREVEPPLPAPARLAPPADWPASDKLAAWQMSARMNRGASVLLARFTAGEAAAQDRLANFVATAIDRYKARRDYPAEPATSCLSDYLAVGEISPNQCWHAAARAQAEGAAGAEHFLKEIVWREFAYHLMHHTPHILTRNWREEWDGFPWQTDPESPEVLAWKQGRTGVALVDAAMREMYVSGRMHNRCRMLVASFLTKHLMTDWRIGMAWFEDCLIDWDPASNAMGWQWTAGSGPDAAPYFRIYNPELQAEKFDATGAYVRRWLAEGQAAPGNDALAFFDAAPRSWGMQPGQRPARPITSLADGRARALQAYETHKSDPKLAQTEAGA